MSTAETSPVSDPVTGPVKAGSLRELLIIAIPMVLSSGTQSLMHIVDRTFLTWHSMEAMEAAMPAGMLFWTALSLFHGTVSYTNTFVAQYEGSDQPLQVSRAVWQGVIFAAFAGLVLTALAPLAWLIFSTIGHSEKIQPLESVYFATLCLGGIPTVVSVALSAFFSGRGKTPVVLLVDVMAVALNGLLIYPLVFGWGPIPRLGIVGAGIATVVANCFMMSAFLVLMSLPAVNRRYQFWRQAGFNGELTRRMLRFGLPNGLLFFVDISGWSLFLISIGWIGERELAATNITFNLNSLSFIPVIGMGIAVSTLVGMRVGEKRPELAVRTTWMAFGLAAAYVLTWTGLYLSFPTVLLQPFEHGAEAAKFEEVKPVIVSLLGFLALYAVFDAMAIIFGSSIRGAGDTKFSMFYTFGCVSLLLVTPTILLWTFSRPTLIMCWTYATFYIVTMGTGFLVRFLRGRWKTMSVIGTQGEVHAPPAVGDLAIDPPKALPA